MILKFVKVELLLMLWKRESDSYTFGLAAATCPSIVDGALMYSFCTVETSAVVNVHYIQK
jgi:hypothetical protein